MGLTIACVFNDAAVRRHCLDRSLAAYGGPVEVEYLPVDNTMHAYASAGAALNHAVRLAHHDVVVLIHQDVYLHDVDRLAAAAAWLNDERWGILGAHGVTAGRMSAGRMRDRVILIGEPAPGPIPVDTLDEVLIMARREDLLADPLSEEPDLAWHAYAVEYALRVRAAGQLAGAVDTAITHNSMTTNLSRLDEAHRHVGDLYPALRPIHTTCGTVTARSGPDWRGMPLVRSQGWRRSWLRQSRAAARVRAELDVPVVLADIAHEVDLVDWSPSHPLHLVNVDRTVGFAASAGRPVVLERNGRPVTMSAIVLSALPDALAVLDREERVLVTGLALGDLAPLRPSLADGNWLAGVQWGEVWLVGGPAATRPPEEWSRPQAVPMGTGRSRR